MKWIEEKNGMIMLYNVDSERVLVYRLIPKKDKIYDYKKNELEKIDEDKLVFVAKTYEGEPVLKRYLNGSAGYGLVSNPSYFRPIDSSKLHYSEKNKFLYDFSVYGDIEKHTFTPWDSETEKYVAKENLKSREEIIEDYCYRLQPSKYYIRVNDDSKIGVDAMILDSENHFYDFNNIFTGILNIPKTIYDFELFLHGEFNQLAEEQIRKILGLYENIDVTKPIFSISFNDLRNINKYIPSMPGYSTIDSIENYVKNDEKVLKLIMK